MGLILPRTIKGIDCEYWKILKCMCNYETGTCRIWLALYVDKATRDENIRYYHQIEVFEFQDITLEREDMYPKIKEPVYEMVEDDEGNPEQVQVNEFVDAVDAL